MRAKQLALKLAALTEAEREPLLAELPPTRRADLQRMIDDAQTLLQATGESFETMMNDARLSIDAGPSMDERLPKDTRLSKKAGRFDQQRLTQVLSGETLAVKRQLMTVFGEGDSSLMTPHVSALLADYLSTQMGLLPDVAPTSKPKKFWARWWS